MALKKVRKLVRKGKVAVIVSPGYGAGWSTWATDRNVAFDREIALAILGESKVPLDELAELKYGVDSDNYSYTGGLSQAKVEWLPKGTRFRIDEYDGFETLVVECSDDNILTA